ncbi:MAG: outer membrane protein TolC [Crocinitomix sp.]|jgi:outer membrane protein TolC
MKNWKILSLVIILFFTTGFAGKAQDAQSINLETVLELGGANNLTIQKFQLERAAAVADLAKAKEWWLPDLYAGISMHQLWGNAMNGNGAFFTDVNRQSFWGGVGFDANWNFAEGVYTLKAERLKAEALQYKNQAEKNQVLLKIISSYYDFLSAQLYYKTYENLVSQADTISQQIAVQVEAGLRYSSELLMIKSNINHLKVEMLNAKITYNEKSADLIALLNLDPTIELVATDLYLAPIELLKSADMATNYDSVYANRAELKGMAMELESINMQKKVTTTGLLIPQLSVGAYSSVFGDVFSPINPTSEINLALRWRIPTGRLVYKGELLQYDAHIAIQELEMDQTKATINAEVLKASQLIKAAKAQMDLAEEGTQFAEEAMQMSINRQNVGTVLPYEILQTQELYIKSKLDYLEGIARHNKAQYAYYVAVGNDL